jgi:hypothetical protein
MSNENTPNPAPESDVTDIVGAGATATTAETVTPANTATTIAPGYAAAVASVLPEGSTLSGEPSAETPITQGFFSHIVTGFVAKIEELVAGNPTVSAAAAYAQGIPSVGKLEGDIEQIAADETLNALTFLQKAKAIALGDPDTVISDAEAAARDLALGLIPQGLQGVVTSFTAQAISKVAGVAMPVEQGIAVAIQHGINALSARLAHITS